MNGESIRQKTLSIKDSLHSTRGDWIVVAIVLLVGIGSFGMGRVSAREAPKTLVEPQNAAVATAIAEAPELAKHEGAEPSPGGQLVASRNGSKYHFPWCSGAQRIAERNKIWFDSIEDARRAGYTPAANCKGLE